MHLKLAQIEHQETLLVVMSEFYAHFNYPFEVTKQRKILEKFLTNRHLGTVWLIENSAEECVGYLALTYGFTFEYGGRDAFIDEFFIREKFRNSGLGAWVLHEIQNKMAILGLNALHLHTESYNQNAKRLYESVGFRDFKRSTLTFLKDEQG
jgi:ribosomal protein S18 acetylase RimI-like enzyme